jgi:hypothetical protein
MFYGQKPGVLRIVQSPRNTTLDVYYTGQQSIRIRGAATSNFYHFSQLEPVQPVDTKDAVFLLSSRLFRLPQ